MAALENNSSAAAAPSSPRVGAFFDMDKTLIDENSGALYFKRRYARGEIGRLELLRHLASYLRNKMGLLDAGEWMRELAAQYQGMEAAALARESEKELGAALIAHLYPQAEALVRLHRARGHLVGVVSASTEFVVAPLARHLQSDFALATRFETREGRLTGRLVQPPCFGAGKVHWLRDLASRHNIVLARSWFYSDSISDLPALELVGHPVAVNPDPRLYREAARRRWPVQIFARRGAA